MPARRAIAAALLAAMLVGGCAFAQSAAPKPLKPGQPAPEFSAPDFSHHTLNVAAYRGDVVLLNFWASWCEPCLTELPVFRAWQQQYGASGLQVIGVSMDDSPASAEAAARRLKLNFPVVMGTVKLAGRYGGIYGVPVTFLIARDGTVADVIEGAADLPKLDRKIQELLNIR